LRECLSQRASETLKPSYQLFVVREARDLVLVCSELKLSQIFQKIFSI